MTKQNLWASYAFEHESGNSLHEKKPFISRQRWVITKTNMTLCACVWTLSSTAHQLAMSKYKTLVLYVALYMNVSHFCRMENLHTCTTTLSKWRLPVQRDQYTWARKYNNTTHRASLWSIHWAECMNWEFKWHQKQRPSDLQQNQLCFIIYYICPVSIYCNINLANTEQICVA